MQVWSYEPLPEDEGLSSEDGQYEGGFKLVAVQRSEGADQPWWQAKAWQPLDLQADGSER